MGECKWRVRIVTGPCRDVLCTCVSTGCTHGTHQLQSMRTANSLHVFCRADLVCPVDRGSSTSGVYPVKTAGWTRKRHTGKICIGRELPGERPGEVHMRTRNWALTLPTFSQEFVHYILCPNSEDHPHPKQHRHNTASAGSQLGWVTGLAFVAQFRHGGGARRTSVSYHFSLWFSTGIIRSRVVIES